MDWHPTFGVKWWENKEDQSGHTLGWTGYTWSRIYFPDPPKFLDWVHERMKQIKLDDSRQQEEVLQHHRAAERFWQEKVAVANAD